ncbi:MAG: N-6 DNA methylase [Methanomassiliicoccales archaeon]|jgi:tRNA1(Val) A37 N6-methylase TrmN6
MGAVTENTVNDLLAQFLREKGLHIVTQYTGRTLQGRSQPDFVVQDSGLVFGEGEWESSFMKGLKQAYDFGSLGGASGSFVISYPDSAKEIINRRLKDSATPATLLRGVKLRGLLFMKDAKAVLFKGEIDEVFDWLRNGIMHKPWKEDAGAFVSLMRDIVESLSGYLPTSGDYPTFFEHIIATMPKDAGELDTAKRAAAYLLLNQIVFYRIMGQARYEQLEPDSIEIPSDLHRIYFKRVLEDNYAAVFQSDISSLFPDKALPFIKDMITYVNAIQPESFTRDLLGSIFHELIPPIVRKSVAAYYTNPEAARLLAKLTIEKNDAEVADFACGSGTLLMAAYDRKAELLNGELTEVDHKRFLENEITGCDIMPFAAHLAVVQLALRHHSFLTDKVRIAVQDSTSLLPGVVIAPLESSMPTGQTSLVFFDDEDRQKYMIRKGAISGRGEGHVFRIDNLDAVLMNPPFTRKQLIGKEYRRILTDRFPEYSEYESKEQSLFGYFVFLADRFLKVGGRMGFVLPSSSIRQTSSEGMRDLIRRKYDLEYLILSGHRMAFSEDASFSEILLVARKRKPSSKPKETFILATIKEKPSLDNVGSFVGKLKDAYSMAESGLPLKHDVLKSDELDIKVGLRADLMNADWLALLPGEELIGVDVSRCVGFTRLVDIIQEDGIIQGIRFEGSSDYVNVKNTIISRKREERTRMNWEIMEESEEGVKAVNTRSGAGVKVPWNVLKPAARTPSGMSVMEITTPLDYAVEDRFLNDDFFWDEPNPDAVVAKRKSHLKSREGRLLIAGRNHINITSGGTYFIAFCSEKEIVPTWSFWSVKLDNANDARILCLWLNSVYCLSNLYDCKITGTGVYIGWLKPDLLKLFVPDIRNLPSEKKDELLSLFRYVSGQALPPLLRQLKDVNQVRLHMDMELSRILEIPEYQDTARLIDIYAILVKKFESLGHPQSEE